MTDKKFFESKRRDDDSTYVTLTEDAPEWLRDAVYETHDGTLPCDWVYAECRDAFESDDTDEHEYADSATEVYTGKLFAWAAEHYGTGFFSQAEEDAAELGEGGTISEQLTRIQYCAILNIARVMFAARDEERDEGEDEEEESEEAHAP
jgi:hypothetical protein